MSILTAQHRLTSEGIDYAAGVAVNQYSGKALFLPTADRLAALLRDGSIKADIHMSPDPDVPRCSATLYGTKSGVERGEMRELTIALPLQYVEEVQVTDVVPSPIEL